VVAAVLLLPACSDSGRRDRRAGVGDDGDDIVHLIVHDVAIDDPSK